MRVLGLLLLTSCGGAQHPDAGGSPGWQYDFTLSADRRRLDVTVCFEAPYPPSLRPADPDAPGFLLSPAPTERIRVDEADGCAHYAVDLEGATHPTSGAWLATRSGGDVVAPTGLWLWGPVDRPETFRAKARFHLPDGVRVSVPWPKDGDEWIVNEHAYRFIAYAAFGAFDIDAVEVPGATLDVARLENEGDRPDRALVADWLTAQGTAAAALYGRFSVPRVQILVVPVGPSDETSPAPFGTAARGGGPSMLVLLAANAEIENLRRDWVAVHEMVHLETPYVRREDSWMSEGIATYYQEVLRARAGLQSPIDTWSAIEDGLQRGRARGTGRSLEEETRLIRTTRAFERIYWGGAAWAMWTDVEIRTRTHGEKSLDSALQSIDLSRPKIWTARQVLTAIDAHVGAPIATEIADEHLAAVDLPDPERIYARLGIVPDGTRVQLTDEAPERATRDAITARRGSPE